MRLRPLLLCLHLFLVSLLPGADSRELHDLPVLWQHYQQTHAQDGFWTFFYDHYLGDHKDGAEHNALPYHHTHVVAAQVADLPTPLLVWEPAPDLLPTLATEWAAPTRAGTPVRVAWAPWQPPRVG